MPERKTLLLSQPRYEAFKEELADSDWFFRPDWTLFALALGGHRSATFDAIALNSEISVVWRGSHLPLWARPLGVIVAAYGGIVRVSGPRGLRIVCDSLLCMSAVEFLVLRRDAEDAVGVELKSLGRDASALKLIERKRSGVLGAVFVDDDAQGDYPVIYDFVDALVCPLIAKHERPNSEGSVAP